MDDTADSNATNVSLVLMRLRSKLLHIPRKHLFDEERNSCQWHGNESSIDRAKGNRRMGEAKCGNNRLKCLLISIKIRFRIVSHVATHMSRQVHPIVFHKSRQIEIIFSDSYAQSNADENRKTVETIHVSSKHIFIIRCVCVRVFCALTF